MRSLSIIVAVDEDGGFGKNGKIPWNFSEDLKHFKEITDGNVCIMGRKTYEDMYNMYVERKKISAKKDKSKDEQKEIDIIEPSEILPNRTSFVVTSNPGYKAPGATVVKNIRGAVESLKEDDSREIFVLGGFRMFIEALSWTDTIYMTVIKNKRYDCDKKFPVDILNKNYKIVDTKQTDELYFLTYKRS
jgi:dihydrofolate reductase